MPKSLKVYNVGAKGLNTDVAAWDLPAEFISNGFNFKVFQNSLVSTGGFSDWSTAPTNFYPGLVFPLTTVEGYFWVVPGRTDVYAFDAAAWVSINPAVDPVNMDAGDEKFWTHCYLGQIPIINNPQHYPMYWSPAETTEKLKFLNWSSGVTWKTRGISAQVIRSHKNFLFALNITDGGAVQPDTYRWSTAADVNGLPFTWDESDTSAIAGVASLGGDNGAIVDAVPLRDSLVIYSEYGIDILDYVGGEFIWSRREMSNSVGLFGKYCVTEVEGSHYFISNGDVLKNDGTNLTSIMRGRIQGKFNENFDNSRADLAFITKNHNTKEIWFCVPQIYPAGSSAAYVYNWADEAWSIRDLPSGIAFAHFGDQPLPPRTWNNWTGTWGSQNSPWISNTTSPFATGIIGVTNNPPDLKILEPTVELDSGDTNSTISRDNFTIEGVNVATTLVKMYPHILGTGPVSIQVGSQLIPYGPVRWKPAFVYEPGITKKLDIRTTGLFHSWRISSIGKGNWIFSGMDLEYEESGAR